MLHPSIQSRGPAPAGFSSSPSPPPTPFRFAVAARPTFYSILLVSTCSFHSLFPPPSPLRRFPSCPCCPPPLASPPSVLVTSTSSASRAGHIRAPKSGSEGERARRKEREWPGTSALLLIFPFTRPRNEPPRRQLISPRKSAPLRWKQIPRHLRDTSAFIGSLIARNSNSQTV